MKLTTNNVNTSAVLKKGYVKRLAPDPAGGYTVTVQEFPGCIAEGDTAEEALANFDRAADSWVHVSLMNGQEIREPIDFGGCSGKIALRIPRSLHQNVAELAELEGSSINQVLTAAIAAYVRGDTLMKRMPNVIRDTLTVNGGLHLNFFMNGGSISTVKQVSSPKSVVFETSNHQKARTWSTVKPFHAMESTHG